MEVVYQKEAQEFQNSKFCSVYEYFMEDKEINGALVKLKGRYPDEGYAMNLRCRELVYVIEGSGKLVTNDKEIVLVAGDLILILPNEKYFWEGTMKLFVSATPPWTIDQYVRIKCENKQMITQNYPEPIVGALIINDENEILLVKQDKWQGLYCIPGGHVELKETVEEAIKREVREEVGLEVKINRLLGIQDNINSEYFHKKGKHFIFLDYLCSCKDREVKIDLREIQSFVWVDPEKALTLNLHPGTRCTIERFIKEHMRDYPRFVSVHDKK